MEVAVKHLHLLLLHPCLTSITFFKHNPPMFDGSEGPIAADDWIATFEDLADALSYTDG